MLLLKDIIKKALAISATDIHFIYEINSVKVIFRKARTYQAESTLSFSDLRGIVEYIKFKGNFRPKVAESFFHLSFCLDNISIRASYSCNKTPYLTLRLHSLKPELLNPAKACAVLEKIKRPYNIHIIGHINSGKTTLYYQILKALYEQDLTLLSVEDPIEKHFDFWQIELQSHEKWLELYSQVIRYDLDIVGFGEIRRPSYLKILTKIFLSGHEVITTFHTHSLQAWCQQAEQGQIFGQRLEDLNLTTIFCSNHQYSLHQWVDLKNGNFQPMVTI